MLLAVCYMTCLFVNIVAKQNQTSMLPNYHPGAYGSINKERWSCCQNTDIKVEGCKPCGGPEGEFKLKAYIYALLVCA